jgi:hypothetical protein
MALALPVYQLSRRCGQCYKDGLRDGAQKDAREFAPDPSSKKTWKQNARFVDRLDQYERTFDALRLHLGGGKKFMEDGVGDVFTIVGIDHTRYGYRMVEYYHAVQGETPVEDMDDERVEWQYLDDIDDPEEGILTGVVSHIRLTASRADATNAYKTFYDHVLDLAGLLFDLEEQLWARDSACKLCDSRCRSVKRTSHHSFDGTLRGQCRSLWQSWVEEDAVCVDCGCKGSALKRLELDHVRGVKVHKISDYSWWAHHGGTKAMKKEKEKVDCRCRRCHRERTWASGLWTESEKEAVVAQRELKVARGGCECGSATCPAPELTLDNYYLFDWAHISELAKTSCDHHNNMRLNKPATQEAYYKLCKVLFCMCHQAETEDRETSDYVPAAPESAAPYKGMVLFKGEWCFCKKCAGSKSHKDGHSRLGVDPPDPEHANCKFFQSV